MDRNGILLFGKGVDFQAAIGNALAVVMAGASGHRGGYAQPSFRSRVEPDIDCGCTRIQRWLQLRVDSGIAYHHEGTQSFDPPDRNDRLGCWSVHLHDADARLDPFRLPGEAQANPRLRTDPGFAVSFGDQRCGQELSPHPGPELHSGSGEQHLSSHGHGPGLRGTQG